MKKIFWLGLGIIFFLYHCTPEKNTIQDGTYTGSLASNKTFDYFTYAEFRPAFLFEPPAGDLMAGPNTPQVLRTFPHNIRNPFPIDPVVNLGRVLFYDKNLSLNGQVSCGSCHQQSKAFTDGKAFSHGFNNALTDRGSMSIQNMAFINNYQWEAGSDNLPDLVTRPLTHAIEMGNPSMAYVIEKIRALNYYEPLHQRAFGAADIQEKSVVWALAQFVGSIYSSHSKFDLGFKSNFENFSEEEKTGMTLFHGKALCSTCHAAPTFAAPDFVGGRYGDQSDVTATADLKRTDKKGLANNGIQVDLNDRMKSFKIPTLRNIEYTSPYMHDGKILSLDEVIEQYDHNIQFNAQLDEVFLDKKSAIPQAIRLNLNREEKKALKAFLLTLSDPELLSAKRYADPFQ